MGLIFLSRPQSEVILVQENSIGKFFIVSFNQNPVNLNITNWAISFDSSRDRKSFLRNYLHNFLYHGLNGQVVRCRGIQSVKQNGFPDFR